MTTKKIASELKKIIQAQIAFDTRTGHRDAITLKNISIFVGVDKILMSSEDSSILNNIFYKLNCKLGNGVLEYDYTTTFGINQFLIKNISNK